MSKKTIEADSELVISCTSFEGFRPKIYKCPKGKLTIGHGINLESGITREESLLVLRCRLKTIRARLKKQISFFDSLSRARQNVLVEMAYNMGIHGLLKFKKTLKYLQQAQYKKASDEMLDSRWHRDFIRLAPGTNVEKLRSSQLSARMLRG